MKAFNKAVICGLTLVTLGGALSPVSSVFAAEANVNSSQQTEFDKYYNDLSDSKKSEFEDLVRGAGLTQNEQLQILKDKYTSDREATPRWKAAVLKKGVEFVAKAVGAKLGAKTLTDFVNYLTDFEDNIQEGLENGMVKFLGVNRTVAHWTAKTAMFIFF